MSLPSLAAIEAAAGIVHPVVPPTPQIHWPLLSERAGAEVWVKHENHTPVGAFKIRGGLGKWAIREGMRGVLPEKVRARRDKQGLVAPTERWFRGANREAARELLGSSELAERGLLDRDEVLRIFDEHAAGAENHYMAIWQWLNLELWMRKTFDAAPAPAAARA